MNGSRFCSNKVWYFFDIQFCSYPWKYSKCIAFIMSRTLPVTIIFLLSLMLPFQALKIHISSETKKVLESFHCFDVQLRGSVEMKVSNILLDKSSLCWWINNSVMLLRWKQKWWRCCCRHVVFSLPFAVFDVWSVDFDVVSVIGGLHAFFLELVCTYTIFKFIFIQNLLPGPLLVFSIYLYFFYKVFVFVPVCAFVIFIVWIVFREWLFSLFGYPQACSLLCSHICIAYFLYVLFAWK